MLFFCLLFQKWKSYALTNTIFLVSHQTHISINLNVVRTLVRSGCDGDKIKEVKFLNFDLSKLKAKGGALTRCELSCEAIALEIKDETYFEFWQSKPQTLVNCKKTKIKKMSKIGCINFDINQMVVVTYMQPNGWKKEQVWKRNGQCF